MKPSRSAVALILLVASVAEAQYVLTYPEVRPAPQDNLPINDIFVSLVKVPIVVDGQPALGDQVTVRCEVKLVDNGCGAMIEIFYQPVGAPPAAWASLLQEPLYYDPDGSWQLVQFQNTFLPLGGKINVGFRVTNLTSNMAVQRYTYNVEAQ